MDETTLGGLVGGGAIFLGGLAIMWMAARAAVGRFPRNRWAGIRTSVTLKSDEAWNAAHEAGASGMNAAGTLAAVCGLTAIVAVLLGGSRAVVMGLVLAGAIGMMVLLVIATARGVRAARELD